LSLENNFADVSLIFTQLKSLNANLYHYFICMSSTASNYNWWREWNEVNFHFWS